MRHREDGPARASGSWLQVAMSHDEGLSRALLSIQRALPWRVAKHPVSAPRGQGDDLRIAHPMGRGVIRHEEGRSAKDHVDGGRPEVLDGGSVPWGDDVVHVASKVTVGNGLNLRLSTAHRVELREV